MQSIEDLISQFENDLKERGYNLEVVAAWNPVTDKINVTWNDNAQALEKLNALDALALSLVALADKDDALIQVVLSRAYSLHGLNYIKPDADPQEGLIKAALFSAIMAGNEIINAQQSETIHEIDPTEDGPSYPTYTDPREAEE